MGSEVDFTCGCGERFRVTPGASAVPCPKCGKTADVPAPPPSPAPPAPAEPSDSDLEHLLLKKGIASLDQIMQGRQKQQEESKNGRAIRLGDALIELGVLTRERLKEVTTPEAPPAKVPMKCPSCAKTYYVKSLRPGTRALCKACKVPLVPVGSITDIHPEDVATGTDLVQAPVGEAVDPALVDLIPGYHLERRLGAGGMGQVFLARQKSLDRLVAVKMLSRKKADNPDYVKRFLAEARSAGRLSHENIVAAVDSGQVNTFYFFVMEYVEGETLQAVILRERTLPEKRALEIARQVASGLGHAARHGLIHRDVKPSNIMITPTGQVKICDFGLAREMNSDTRMTQEGTVLSSPAYTSPEQCKAAPNLDHRSDMYALGVTLFEMVTGQLPFRSESASSIFVQHVTTPPPEPRSINPAVSVSVNALILRLLRKEPGQRFRDYDELLTAIVAARENPSAGAAPDRRRPMDTRRSKAGVPRPGRARLGIAAAAAVVLVIVAALALRKGPSTAAGTSGNAVEQDLREAVAQERAAKGKLSEYPQVRARWKALVEKYRATPHFNTFAGPLVEFEARMTEEADRLAEDFLREAGTRMDAGRIADALYSLNSFPRGFEETPGGRRVAARAQDVGRSLDGKFQQGREAAAASITAEQFDDSARRVDDLRTLVTYTGPTGPEFVRPAYREEIAALSRLLEEERLLARKRTLEASAKKDPGPTPPPPPPVVAKPADPAPPPVKAAPPDIKPVEAAPPAKKRPVPDAAALRESEKLVRELFKEDYAKKAAADKVTLARKLIDLAGQSRDDPSGRFVLLREARDLAGAGGNLGVALQAVDELAKEFEVNAAAMKGAALVAAGQGLTAPDEIKAAAVRVLSYADEAIASEDFDGAQKAAAAAAAMARKSKDVALASKADAKVKEVEEAKDRVEKLKKAHETLARNPNDPDACLAIGQYQCVVRGDWASGLALLARGSNPALKELARKELGAPSEPAAQVAMGDEWWDSGDGALGKDENRKRAGYWYRMALPKLAGFTKTKVERRLAEAEALKKK